MTHFLFFLFPVENKPYVDGWYWLTNEHQTEMERAYFSEGYFYKDEKDALAGQAFFGYNIDHEKYGLQFWLMPAKAEYPIQPEQQDQSMTHTIEIIWKPNE